MAAVLAAASPKSAVVGSVSRPAFWPAEAVKETSSPADRAQGATVDRAHFSPADPMRLVRLRKRK
ncbi:MAG: hypothetical protein B7Z40_15645 [Bosea sp. 12-68-7]|nr:MAG: hypothetical protein B7Z40_15645 [Bosea sp. 12-68-7]